MADDNLDLQFQSVLELTLKADGIENVAAGVNDITQKLQKQGKTAKDLVGDYGSLAGAAKKLSKNYKDANKTLDDTNRKLGKLRRNANTVVSPLKEAGNALKRMILPPSFGKALKIVDNYNKSMLGLSASVNRLGIGITGLESNLGRVGKEMSLTRVETNKLFNDFQAGMRTISLKDFEDIMKRIRNTIGSNAEAMGKMSSSIAELSQSYPSLSMALKELASSGKTMSSLEKGLLQTRVSNLYMIGKISDAQYKQITSYIKGNQQIGKWDSKRKKEMDAQTRAVQDFERQWENVSMAVGQTLMPYLPKVANFIKGAFEWTEKWLGSTKKLGIAIVGIMAGMGVMKLAGGAIMGRMIGGGASRGMGGMGGAGGIAASLKPTNVFVVGMAPGVMGKMGVGSQPFVGPPRLPAAAGGAAKLGRGARLGRAFGSAKPGGLLGTAGIYAGSAALVYGGSKGSQALRGKSADLRGQGKGGQAYMTEVGANLSTIGSQAGAGLAIGGRHGGLIGAAIGGSIGLITGAITAGYDTLSGKAEKAAKQARRDKGQFARDFKKEEEDAKKGRAKQKSIADAQKTAITAAGGGNLATVSGDTKLEAAKAQKKYDEAVEKGGYKKKHEDLQDKKEKLERAKASFDEKSAKMNDDQKSGAQKVLKTLQEQYDTAEDKLKTQEKNDDVLQSTLELKNKTAAVAETIKTLSQAQLSIAEKIEALAGSRLSYMDAVIEKTALTGDLEEGKVVEAYKDGMKALKGKEVAYSAALKILESDLDVSEKKTQMMKDQSKEGKILYAGLKEAGAFSEDEAEAAKVVADVRTKILGITKEQSDATNSLTKMYDIQLAKQEQLATQAGLMVQLADNYAIGVGAAAQMRINQYKAEEQAIKVLEDQLNMQVMLASQAGASEEVKNKVYEIENKILQKQMAQAQQVKALRDGWVSAISAMNTGAGGFTDIVMTQTKGLALAQKLAGSVEAQILGRRGEGEGYNEAERFKARRSSFGPNQRLGTATVDSGGRGRWEGPFSGGGDMSWLERNERGEAYDKVVKEMQRGGRDIIDAGAEMLGAGHKMALSAEMESRGKGFDFVTGKRKGTSRGKSYSSRAGGAGVSAAEEVNIDAKNVYINGENVGGALAGGGSGGRAGGGASPKLSAQDKITAQSQKVGMMQASLAVKKGSLSKDEIKVQEKNIEAQKSKLDSMKKDRSKKAPLLTKEYKQLLDAEKAQKDSTTALKQKHGMILKTGGYKTAEDRVKAEMKISEEEVKQKEASIAVEKSTRNQNIATQRKMLDAMNTTMDRKRVDPKRMDFDKVVSDRALDKLSPERQEELKKTAQDTSLSKAKAQLKEARADQESARKELREGQSDRNAWSKGEWYNPLEGLGRTISALSEKGIENQRAWWNETRDETKKLEQILKDVQSGTALNLADASKRGDFDPKFSDPKKITAMFSVDQARLIKEISALKGKETDLAAGFDKGKNTKEDIRVNKEELKKAEDTLVTLQQQKKGLDEFMTSIAPKKEEDPKKASNKIWDSIASGFNKAKEFISTSDIFKKPLTREEKMTKRKGFASSYKDEQKNYQKLNQQRKEALGMSKRFKGKREDSVMWQQSQALKKQMDASRTKMEGLRADITGKPKKDVKVTPVESGVKTRAVAEGVKPREVAEGVKPREVAEGVKPRAVAEGVKPREVAEGVKPREVDFRVKGRGDSTAYNTRSQYDETLKNISVKEKRFKEMQKAASTSGAKPDDVAAKAMNDLANDLGKDYATRNKAAGRLKGMGLDTDNYDINQINRKFTGQAEGQAPVPAGAGAVAIGGQTTVNNNNNVTFNITGPTNQAIIQEAADNLDYITKTTV